MCEGSKWLYNIANCFELENSMKQEMMQTNNTYEYYVNSWLVGCQKLIGWLSKADWLVVNSWLVGCQQLIGSVTQTFYWTTARSLSIKQATSYKNLLCRYFIDVRQLLCITKCQQKSSYCTNNNNKVMSLTEAKLTSC